VTQSGILKGLRMCMLSGLVYCSKWLWFSKGCVCVACGSWNRCEQSGILMWFEVLCEYSICKGCIGNHKGWLRCVC